MKVAVVQLSSQENVQSNLEAAERALESAQAQGAQLALLPEGFAFLGSEAEKGKVAESLQGDGPIMSALVRWARQLDMTLIAGGLPEKSQDAKRPYNTSVVLSSTGELQGIYRKAHLFDIDLPDGTRLCESRATTPGSEIVVSECTDLELGRIGLSICYDLRFPEVFREQVRRGAEILTLPAAFTATTGRAHFIPLLRARAIECQCYVLAAAQWGEHPGGRKTFGHSMIIDPWGEVLAELPEGQGAICAEVSRERLNWVRQQMPLDAHRRFDGAAPSAR